MIERGVMPDHDPREPWFLSYSHSDSDIDETLNVLRDAVKICRPLGLASTVQSTPFTVPK